MRRAGLSVLNPDFSPLILSKLGAYVTTGPSRKTLPPGDGNTKQVTLQQLRAQAKDKPWFIVDDEVYDGTEYLRDHPGGESSILLVAGEDASEDFNAIHSADARAKLRQVSSTVYSVMGASMMFSLQFHIGTLVNSDIADDTHKPSKGSDDASGHFLSPRLWRQVTLVSCKAMNHDTRLYRFALPSSEQPLGLPIGQHVFVRLRRKDDGVLVQRAYTPVSDRDAKGYIEFLIKSVFQRPVMIIILLNEPRAQALLTE